MLSYSAITNSGKVTLPSVDSWGTNMNIIKEIILMLLLFLKINDSFQIHFFNLRPCPWRFAQKSQTTFDTWITQKTIDFQ